MEWFLTTDTYLNSYGDFQAYTRQKKNKTYILKPETGCQGKGIWVTKNPKEIKPHEHMICQQYMPKVSIVYHRNRQVLRVKYEYIHARCGCSIKDGKQHV